MPTWKVKVIVPQDFREGKKKETKEKQKKIISILLLPLHLKVKHKNYKKKIVHTTLD